MQTSTVILWLLRASVPVCIAYVISAVLRVWKNRSGVFGTEDSSPESVKVARTNMRALLSSVVNAVVTSVAAVMLVRAGGNPSIVATRFGLVFAAVTGFVFDLVGTTDEAVENFKSGKALGFVTRKLFSWDFVRYMVTVLLDVMVTAPVVGGILSLLNDTPLGGVSIKSTLAAGGSYDRVIAQNLETIVSTIVAAVAFNAYSQQTKAAWAYVDRSYPAAKRISGSSVFLATAVAGAGLVAYQSKYAESLGARVMYVMTALSLMTMLSMYGRDDKQEDEYNTPTGSTLPGLAVLMAFFAFGVIGPLRSGAAEFVTSNG